MREERAGETVNIEFEITENMLKYYHSDNFYKSDAGKFEVYIGGNSKTQ